MKVCSNNITWLLSSIYASPHIVERKILWSNLSLVAQLHNMSWLLLGDFNEVLTGEDKFGGRSINLNKALDFKDCLDSCNLLDLGFSGPKYTWSNQRELTDLILEIIDRCFANPSWRILFPEASVTHLPRVFSDHYPILLELAKPPVEMRNKPFRFQSMWLMHPEFPGVVKESWDREPSLNNAISVFTRKAKDWNVNVFGNLFARKRRVLARLNGAQKVLAINPSDFLIQLEKNLIEEYDLIMLQEEEYWALKSRLNWASFGDRNTSFFHISTMVRRNRNKIRCIKDNNGEWIMEEDGVKEFILAGYRELFSTKLIYSSLSSEVSHFSRCFLTDEEKNRLNMQTSGEEIRASLWALKAFKAPKPNGLHAGFFQYFWHDVKESVCMEIKKIFASGSMPNYLNKILISLIPKCQHPEAFGSYRPISL